MLSTLSYDQWAEEYFILPPGSATPGLIQMDRTPYLRGILQALSPTSSKRWICAIKGTQLALTTAGEMAIQAKIDLYGGNILIIFGSDDMALEYVKSRFEPALEDNPRLAGNVKDTYDRSAKNTKRLKAYPGGNIKLAGGVSGNSFRSFSASLVEIDAADALPSDVSGTSKKTGEGNPFLNTGTAY